MPWAKKGLPSGVKSQCRPSIFPKEMFFGFAAYVQRSARTAKATIKRVVFNAFFKKDDFGNARSILLFLGWLYLNDVAPGGLAFAVTDHFEELEVCLMGFLVP